MRVSTHIASELKKAVEILRYSERQKKLKKGSDPKKRATTKIHK